MRSGYSHAAIHHPARAIVSLHCSASQRIGNGPNGAPQ